jgi:Ca2+-binding RTX toxin-like protein
MLGRTDACSLVGISLALALALIAAPVASAKAGAPAPDPADTRFIGADLSSVPPFGSGLGGSCTVAGGGCSLFGTGAGNDAAFVSPIQGQVVGAAVALQIPDLYEGALQIADLPGGGAISHSQTIPLGTVGSGGGADRVQGFDLDPEDVRIDAGQMVGLAAFGETGPSLIEAPGAFTGGLFPALAPGQARGFDDSVEGKLIPLAAQVEPLVDVAVVESAASPVVPGKPWARHPALWWIAAKNLGAVPARGIEIEAKAGRKKCSKSPCKFTFPTIAPGRTAVKTISTGFGAHGVHSFGATLTNSETLEPQTTAAKDNNRKRVWYLIDDEEMPKKKGARRCNRVKLGTLGPDALRGSSASELILGLAADDSLRGGGGGDCVIGGDGDDRIRGDAGSDALSGEEGDDRLKPGSGQDIVHGGFGNDRVYARDGQRDSIDCGPGGRDLVVSDAKDQVAGNCERVRS